MKPNLLRITYGHWLHNKLVLGRIILDRAWGVIMERLQGTGDVIRKVAGITLIGFLVVVLIGPVLTVAGALLPFALVGLLVYIPYRLLLASKQGGWPAVRDLGKKAVRTAVALPLWIGGRVTALVSFILRAVFRLIGTVFGLVFAVGTGAVIGAALGFIGGMEHHDLDMRVPAGALIGASVGLLALVLKSKPAARQAPVVAQPAAHVQQAHA
jgi:hypothetical protein